MKTNKLSEWEWKGCTVFQAERTRQARAICVGDCSHEIKRHLLLGRKVMTNLDIEKLFKGGSEWPFPGRFQHLFCTICTENWDTSKYFLNWRYQTFSFWICYSCCSVSKSRPTLCNFMDYITTSSCILHCLPEFSQIHFH